MTTTMRIQKRWLLVILVAGAQLMCLLGGLSWYGRWLQSGLNSKMRNQTLSINEQIAEQTVEMIRNMNITEIRMATPDWTRLQKLVEQTKLPNDGFICLIDNESGRMLCHPDLRQNSTVLSIHPGKAMLQGPAGGRRILDIDAKETSSTGWAQFPDGTHLIAVRDIPELNVKVLAHQREIGISSLITQVENTIWNVGIVVAVVMAGLTILVTVIIVRSYESKIAKLNDHLEDLVERRSHALMKTRNAVIFGLAKLAESRDDNTGEHLERITRYVEVLARELAKTHPELTDEMIHTIALASSLHDIGKVGIPDSVLLKAGRLSKGERIIIEKHPTIGGDCLLAIKQQLGEDDFLTTACQIAFSHHERWDGKGYPYGLNGTNIPLAGRIVALADVYDALRSQRDYKQSLTHEKACRIITSNSEKHFDPEIVKAFVVCEKEFDRIARDFAQEAHLQTAA